MEHHTQAAYVLPQKVIESGAPDIEYVWWDNTDLVLRFVDGRVMRLKDIRLAVQIGLAAQSEVGHA